MNTIPNAEEIILDIVSHFLAKGFRKIDFKRYNRVASFDFAEVIKLLELGANPYSKKE